MFPLTQNDTSGVVVCIVCVVLDKASKIEPSERRKVLWHLVCRRAPVESVIVSERLRTEPQSELGQAAPAIFRLQLRLPVPCTVHI